MVNQSEVEKRFFVHGRKTGGGITLTDDLLRSGELFQYRNLGAEVEARWNPVETTWALDTSAALLAVRVNSQAETLFVATTRSGASW